MSNYIEGKCEKSVEWYRKAAENGNAQAQNHLGFMYQYGYGVAKDYSEAVKWYRKAAQQGIYYAQKVLLDLGEAW